MKHAVGALLIASLLFALGHVSSAPLAGRQAAAIYERVVGPSQASAHFWSGVSPDGKYLAYSDASSGNLAVREVQTGATRLLTKAQPPAWGGVEFAAWSPDGRLLAYSARRSDTVPLMVISIDGGEPRVAHPGTGFEDLHPFGWTPDASAVLTSVTHSAGTELALISVTDGSIRTIRRGAVDHAVLSPDGSSVLFDVPAPDRRGRDVFLLNVSTGEERPVAAHKADDFALGWDPQSKFLLIGSARRSRTIDLWSVRLQDGQPTGEPSLVVEDTGRAVGLGFSRNGQFYYAAESGGLDVHLAGLTAEGTAAGPPTPLGGMRPGYRRGQGAWSPDGRRLAFTEQAPGGARDLVVRWDGGEAKDQFIPIPLSAVERPIWFPDGKSVAVEAIDVEGRRGSFKVNLDSGRTELLTLGAIAPGFSADGKSMIFMRLGRPRTFVRRNLSTGSEEILEKGEGGLVVSPDGEWMMRFIESGGVVVFYAQRIGGGTRREFHRLASGKLTNEFAWSRDGSHFYFVTVDPEQLWRVPVAGGEAKQLGISLPSIKHLSVSPDNRIAITGGVVQTEIRRSQIAHRAK